MGLTATFILAIWCWLTQSRLVCYSGIVTKQQLLHEIRWLQQEIEKLRLLLPKKPSVIKQIHEYERQIRRKEVNIAFGENTNVQNR